MCIEIVIQPTSNSSLHDLCNGHKDTALLAFVIECVRKEVPRVDWNCTVANTKNTHKKYASRTRSFSKVNVRNPVGWGRPGKASSLDFCLVPWDLTCLLLEVYHILSVEPYVLGHGTRNLVILFQNSGQEHFCVTRKDV
jgi:hypothetical protein